MVSAVADAHDAARRPASLTWLAAVILCGSGALLLAALGFQYLGGYAPCSLCYWQRYGHIAVMAAAWLALLPLGTGARVALLSLAGVGLLATAGLAAWHVGVEWKWWPGPESCTSTSLMGMSVEQALNALRRKPVVLCDSVAWSLFGVSMAGWNAIFSAALGAWALAGTWRLAPRGGA